MTKKVTQTRKGLGTNSVGLATELSHDKYAFSFVERIKVSYLLICSKHLVRLTAILREGHLSYERHKQTLSVDTTHLIWDSLQRTHRPVWSENQ